MFCVDISNRDITVLLGASFKEVDRKPAADLCQLFYSVLRWQIADAGRRQEGGFDYFTPIGERSIVMSVFVCLSVCFLSTIISSEQQESAVSDCLVLICC